MHQINSLFALLIPVNKRELPGGDIGDTHQRDASFLVGKIRIVHCVKTRKRRGDEVPTIGSSLTHRY